MNKVKERIARSCVCCESKTLKKSPAVLMPFVSDRIFGWAPIEITDEWGLETIKNGMAYALCNSVQCQNCSHLFLDIRFDDNEMNSLYNGYREKEYVELRNKYEPGYKERNDSLNAGIEYISDIESFLLPYLKLPINVLDWGGDTGKNTPFKNNNKIFHIYDISNKSVIPGAERVDTDRALSTQYDLVVCSNVLEHVPHPLEIVLNITKSMTEGTILYIEVPHEDIIRTSAMEVDVYKKKKHWHEHINFYTEQSLKELVEKCGLEVVALQQLEATAGGHSSHLFQLACKLK